MENGLLLAADIGHSEFSIGTRFALGALLIELFNPVQAVDHLKISLDIAENLDSRTLTHLSYGALAGAYLAQNRITLAQNCLDEVISDQTAMDTVGKRYCWVRQAEITLAQEDPEFTLEIIDRLIASIPGIKPDDVITYLWMLKGISLARLGEYCQAETFLLTSVDNAKNIGERFLLWRAHASLGRLYLTMDQPDAADNRFKTSKSIVKEIAATIPDDPTNENFIAGANSILVYNKENIF